MNHYSISLRLLRILPVLLLISGCTHTDIMSPDHPFNGKLRDDMLAETTSNMLSWESDYYGGTEHASVAEEKRRVLRDLIGTKLMQLIDEYQREFNGNFYGRSTIGTSALEITGGGLGAAAAITSPASISKLLAGVGSGVIGSSAILQKDIFQQKAIYVILARSEVLRATERKLILDGLKKSTVDYPLVDLLADLADYSNDGSIMAGLAAIDGDTAAMKSNITKTRSTGNGPPEITSPTSVAATLDVPFRYQVVGDRSPTSYDATGLPDGLTIDKVTGIISGKPTKAGATKASVSATNDSGTNTLTLSISVAEAAITSPLTASGNVGLAFSYTISANNAPTIFTATGLPAGLAVDKTGKISGTPTAIGVSNCIIGAANGTDTSQATLVITIQ